MYLTNKKDTVFEKPTQGQLFLLFSNILVLYAY